ncbi:MAG TPA: glycoside hydrolase family 16 protein [Labilithrix sp.]|nr:glycoside hydrolase family 16 protein [Labilithrix sp.]
MRKHALCVVVSVFGLSSLLAGCLSAALGEGAEDDAVVAPSQQLTNVDASGTGPAGTETDDAGPGGDAPLPEEAKEEEEEVAPACVLAGPPAATEGDTLVWSDEFDGDALDWKKWYVHDGYEGHGTILNTFSPSAVTVHDGSLHVAVQTDSRDPAHPYASGRIETFGRFSRTYGRIDFRARFPYAPGVWYAVWARPATTAMPELDFEILGNNANQVWLVNHWDVPPKPADDRRKYVIGATDVTQFHVYSIVWKPSSLEWQIDGKTYMTSTTKGVPTSPIAWTINGWVGGWGAAATPTVPVSFEVDWIRVYRQDGLIADPTLRLLNPKKEYAGSEFVDLEPANFDEACYVVDVYEGSRRIDTLRQWPYRFRMKNLAPGAHELAFVATDGQRSATTSFAINVK